MGELAPECESTLAAPKSPIFTWSEGSTNTLLGFRSWWTTPRTWAACERARDAARHQRARGAGAGRPPPGACRGCRTPRAPSRGRRGPRGSLPKSVTLTMPGMVGQAGRAALAARAGRRGARPAPPRSGAPSPPPCGRSPRGRRSRRHPCRPGPARRPGGRSRPRPGARCRRGSPGSGSRAASGGQGAQPGLEAPAPVSESSTRNSASPDAAATRRRPKSLPGREGVELGEQGEAHGQGLAQLAIGAGRAPPGRPRKRSTWPSSLGSTATAGTLKRAAAASTRSARSTAETPRRAGARS